MADVAMPEAIELQVDNITDYAIYMLDPTGLVASWNEGARRIKGYEAVEIIGQHFSVFYPAEAREQSATTDMLRAAVEAGHTSSEGWRLRKSGERFWASVVITSVHRDGVLIGFSKVTRDLSERKVAEDALRLSEERYRLLIDGVREYAIVGLDVEGRVTSWNAGAARTKGYSAVEIVGKHFSIFFPVLEIAAGAPQRALALAVEHGRHESEGWRLGKGGRRFWAHVVLTAVLDGERLIGFSKVTQDITERRNTEEALRHSEERYRMLIAGVRDYAILALDTDGAVTSWNAGAALIKGYDEAEILGRHFSVFYAPADVAAGKPQAGLRHAVTTGRFEEEGWRVRKDGTRFMAHVVITAIHDRGELVGFSKVTRDVTERQRVEASLRSTRHLLEASHSMSKLGGWELDFATDAMVWTDEVFRIHEVDPATYVPSLAGWLGFFTPEAIVEVSAALQRAMKVGEDFSLELPFKSAKGRIGWLHVTSRVVFEGGRPVRIAGALQDVTTRAEAQLEVRKLNAMLETRVLERTEVINEINARLRASETTLRERALELAEARDEAIAANHIKASLLANLSHEIRTPLAAVIGLADVLGSTALSLDQDELVRAIRSSGAGLLSILNDILDFSKLEAGRLQPDLLPFATARVIEDAIDVLAVQAAAKRLEVIYVVKPGVPAMIVSDFGRIRQILVNLLSNAVKFTSSGLVSVTVGLHSVSPLILEVAVRDTGMGVPANKLDKLFQTFSQVDASTAREYGGTGLGLALCRALCTLLEGTINVVSEPGHGSTFTVRIPVEAAISVATPATDSALLAGRRVLLVKAAGEPRDVLAAWLADCGAEITLADRVVVPDASTLGLLDFVVVDESERAGDRALLDSLRATGRPPPCMLLHWPSTNGVDRTGYTASALKPLRHASLMKALGSALGVGGVKVTVSKVFEALRVTVVEDNLVNQRVSTHMLTQLGHEVTIVPDGAQALERIPRERPDVVLMDVHLPGLDGLEVTRRLVATLARSRRPWIIALTAGALSGDRDECLAAGMDDYLSKPVSLEVLAACLSRVPRHASTLGRQPLILDAPRAEELWRGLDRDVIEALVTLGAETRSSLLAELLQVFFEESPRRFCALEEAIAANDAPTVRHTAHTLRGSCNTLGASDLATILLDIEVAARNADFASCAVLLPRARAQLAAVEVSMRQVGSKIGSPFATES